MARRRSGGRYGTIITVIAIILTLLGSLFYYLDVELNLFGRYKPLEDSIEIHIIDVGQADSILIKAPEGNVLIDGGAGDSETALRSYLKAKRVKEIEYFFCTHPDEDHIGSADMVINEFDVNNVILTTHISSTQTYEKLLDAIENKGDSINRIVAKVDNEYTLGELKLKILAPIGSSSNNNNSSIVLRAQYGSTVSIFTGDADVNSENEIMEKYSSMQLKCDLLKLGHHGSHTSTSEEWLNVTSPKLAAISCGKDNKYGHPHDEITKRLEKHGIPYYRTDLEGSIVFVSDGMNITKED